MDKFGMRKLASAVILVIIILITFSIAAPRPVSAGQAPLISIHPLMKQPGQADIPLNQALVLEGGESTNPREYDPATTHGSGDKRAFSGLVSFDPQLNLTPDLAESWDVSDDGMTYTFHLRTNAKFHDGRAVTAPDFVYSLERARQPCA